jgi:hypothetical protein
MIHVNALVCGDLLQLGDAALPDFELGGLVAWADALKFSCRTTASFNGAES